MTDQDGTEEFTTQTEREMAGTLPNPALPMDVARALIAREDWLIRFWQEDFYEHAGTHWEKLGRGEMLTRLFLATESATYVTKNAEGDMATKPWAPNPGKVKDLETTLGRGVVPFYGENDVCMALTNGVLDVDTRTLKDHTPARFNLSFLPFAYDPGATCPSWLAFLESSLPGDPEAHRLIRQWFGYVLSGRKNLHKILALIGPRRSGKGTVASVLQAMVGPEGWAAPILSQLARPFGTEDLIGKRLAVMGDVRWQGKDTQEAVPILLALGSEDGMTITRKNEKSWTGRLAVRAMMMSNDLPSFIDPSGALAGRLMLVEFSESFYGREDAHLMDRLLQELPGILNWALDGLADLTQAGAFTEPGSAGEARDEMERSSSPAFDWADSWYQFDAEAPRITVDAAFQDFLAWCKDNNIKHEATKQRFSRDLRSALKTRGVMVKRDTTGAKLTYVYGMRRNVEMPVFSDPNDAF
jgi:putative DNA primase/helicase